MIDNFDELVERCNARRRRHMLRISFRIAGSILLLIAAVAGYLQWLSPKPEATNIPAETAPATTPPLASPIIEKKVSKTVEEPVKTLPPSGPASSDTKRTRLYSLQLISSDSYQKTAQELKKVPERYRSGMAIYQINGYYTLRYIDIFDKSALPGIIREFKQSGFRSPIAYPYNPDRTPITQDVTPSSAVTESGNLPQTVQPPVAAKTSGPETSLNTPPAKAPAAESLFQVKTPSQSSEADPLKSYEANPGFETALAVARSYYGKKEFAEAAVWAKKANQLNREAEEAWLLYAKSYYAQGRKKEAINVLELYLKYKDSKAATELLRSWKRP